MVLRAVVFELDGVLVLPSASGALRRAEEELAVPGGFLSEAFKRGGPDGSSVRLMTGEITFSQWASLLDEDFRKYSKDSGIRLPENSSVNQIFGKAMSARKINHPMLWAAPALRKKGFTTCILTNNYLDDSTQRGSLAQLMCELRPHFDLLIESCQIGMAKPDPRIYRFMLDTLKASPNEVRRRFLSVEKNVLLETAAPLPTPCNPSDVSHGYVPIKPGVRLHFVELGSGPAVCLCHGFPESWFSWRYQIPALAQAGFRVLAVDMKGYGESSAPPEIEEYSMEVLCKDMVTFLDKLGISQAVFIGHDWGGMLVWNMALFYPERVRAVASLNTPYIPANPNRSLMETIKANPVFDYQLYFQEPVSLRPRFEVVLILKDGYGLDDILVRESAFRGPLNWYRNIDRNWKWGCKGTKRKILIPALMVTAEKDMVLVPKMSKHMEDWIPHLKRGHIKDCGHFTQMEKPTELNRILVEWLETDARDSPRVSKL
ncbi:bifunctional epoxide hydrolase 2 [Pteropus vampyrus]|uniref:Bifunctional epoxide hydrolase 2 n=1 Tax=Pteropus vampyrus TaxID=132908 RepID=A0A6P6CGZ1_PTEVA|nr:bifunctional epoxide hydrolase 2 [Pteropus vampyrus]